ncbi:hypothetical protein FB45DRAFT_1066734 [Roridomyces roridus]|uniref:Uncharacterized protein n=1 Tax=Roridomyces roridus TaxID=1738132 RepID=A0AAD7B4H5_9AGAR|nr:hypothetical protein FB45DRAFT_1066734 [Roridomyces roridus]
MSHPASHLPSPLIRYFPTSSLLVVSCGLPRALPLQGCLRGRSPARLDLKDDCRQMLRYYQTRERAFRLWFTFRIFAMADATWV